jgi:hypothetical protein
MPTKDALTTPMRCRCASEPRGMQRCVQPRSFLGPAELLSISDRCRLWLVATFNYSVSTSQLFEASSGSRSHHYRPPKWLCGNIILFRYNLPVDEAWTFPYGHGHRGSPRRAGSVTAPLSLLLLKKDRKGREHDLGLRKTAYVVHSLSAI